MPRLFKKLSRKSLRKRTQSTTSSKDLPIDIPPPVPGPKSAASDASFGFVVSSTFSKSPNGSSQYLPPTDPYIDKPFPPTPTSNGTNGNGYLSPNGAPPPSLPPVVTMNGSAVPQDEFSKDLQAAWASASTDPKASKADKVLLTLGQCHVNACYGYEYSRIRVLENGVAGAMVQETKGAAFMTGIKTGLDAVGGLEAIEKGLNSFMEGMPVLMNALDEVAKLHPYVLMLSTFMRPN